VGGGGYKERMKEAKCSVNILYSCIKMEKCDLLKLFWKCREERYKGK
jgi:hypothetical protein